MWSGYQAVVDQSFTEGLLWSKHVSRYQRQDCEQECQEQLAVFVELSFLLGSSRIDKQIQPNYKMFMVCY